MTELSAKLRWETTEKLNKRRSLITTIALHLLLILLLLYMMLLSPFPPPAEEGILINFGNFETGMGDEQPSSPESAVAETTSPSADQQEEVMTQSTEDAPSIEQEIKSPSSKDSKVPEPEVNQDALLNPEKFKNATSSEGQTDMPGDQGVRTGDPDALNYKGERSIGLGDDGIGYDLSGRSWVRKPKINDISQERGKVVILIRVDRFGKVISAIFQQKGSTTTNVSLIAKAKKASFEARFSPTSQGPEYQTGVIVYNFKLK